MPLTVQGLSEMLRAEFGEPDLKAHYAHTWLARNGRPTFSFEPRGTRSMNIWVVPDHRCISLPIRHEFYLSIRNRNADLHRELRLGHAVLKLKVSEQSQVEQIIKALQN